MNQRHFLALLALVGLLLPGTLLAASKKNNDYPIPSSSYPVATATEPTSTNNNSGDRPFLGAVELGAQYPAVLGNMGQNFNAGIGFHGAIHLNLLGDFRSAIYVGYQNLKVRADKNTSFRVVPILAQFGVEAKTNVDWIYTTFDLGVGGAFGWLATKNPVDFQTVGYFAAQIQPGIEFVATDMFSVIFHMPVLYLIGKNPMGYLAYDGGVKINF